MRYVLATACCLIIFAAFVVLRKVHFGEYGPINGFILIISCIIAMRLAWKSITWRSVGHDLKKKAKKYKQNA